MGVQAFEPTAHSWWQKGAETRPRSMTSQKVAFNADNYAVFAQGGSNPFFPSSPFLPSFSPILNLHHHSEPLTNSHLQSLLLAQPLRRNLATHQQRQHACTHKPDRRGQRRRRCRRQLRQLRHPPKHPRRLGRSADVHRISSVPEPKLKKLAHATARRPRQGLGEYSALNDCSASCYQGRRKEDLGPL